MILDIFNGIKYVIMSPAVYRLMVVILILELGFSVAMTFLSADHGLCRK
jgi:hypothetical protein